MVEPITTAMVTAKAKGVGLKVALKLAKDMYNAYKDPKANKRIRAAWDEERKNFHLQRIAHLSELIVTLGREFEDLRAYVEGLRDDPQFQRIQQNFYWEAEREAIDERRKMLALASAGVVHPDLSIERKARVERTLRELDPREVRDLWAASRLIGATAERHGTQNLKAAEIWKIASKRRSFDVLVSSGCIRTMSAGGDGMGDVVQNIAIITGLGHEVLLATRAYTANRKPSYPAPGRDPAEDELSAEASAVQLEKVAPGITEFLEWVPRQTAVYKKRRLRILNSHITWMQAINGSSVTLEIVGPVDDLEERFVGAVPKVGADLTVAFTKRRYTPEQGTEQIHTVLTLKGRHDLVKAAGELSDSFWRAW